MCRIWTTSMMSGVSWRGQAVAASSYIHIAHRSRHYSLYPSFYFVLWHKIYLASKDIKLLWCSTVYWQHWQTHRQTDRQRDRQMDKNIQSSLQLCPAGMLDSSVSHLLAMTCQAHQEYPLTHTDIHTDTSTHLMLISTFHSLSHSH